MRTGFLRYLLPRYPDQVPGRPPRNARHRFNKSSLRIRPCWLSRKAFEASRFWFAPSDRAHHNCADALPQ